MLREVFVSFILVYECRTVEEFLLENRTEYDSLRAPRIHREKSVFDFKNLDDFAQQVCQVYNETVIRKISVPSPDFNPTPFR